MKKQNDAIPTYTTIYHDLRVELKLNLLEYVLLDAIFRLSKNDKGYCYKSIRSFARDLGMSPEGIRTAIARLVVDRHLIPHRNGYKASKKFVEKWHEKTGRKTDTNRSSVIKTDTNRSTVRKVGSGDRKTVTSVRKVGSEQMLELYKNNNRDTYGSPREDPREPKEIKPPNPKALELQERIKRIHS